ncbi:MAG: ATP-binding protein [Burkholderiales bacterium]
MQPAWKQHGTWIAIWGLLFALGAIVLARMELARLDDAFQTDARIAHRLLSQRMVEHDAVLAMLALLQPTQDADDASSRLAALYPQILAVARRGPGQTWPAYSAPALNVAEARSRQQRHPTLAGADISGGRYLLVLAAEPASQSLTIDLLAAVPWDEWPMQPDQSPVRVRLEHAGSALVLQPGKIDGNAGWRFDFRKTLASPSQPFDVVAARQVGWAELPWSAMVALAIGIGMVLWAIRAWQRQRAARERAEELLRLGQVARLNTMGELAAGMAHELNQPLTALLANTQAAGRLLDDEPPDLATARSAMAQAAAQARRAADVVQRLRRAVERPDLAAGTRSVALQGAMQRALHLLAPEFERCHVEPVLEPHEPPLSVRAEPVALEQIIHNLLTNALHALSQVDSNQRQLQLRVDASGGDGILTVADTGCGIAPELLARIFEPFYSTREGGLGLGLSLSETLAAGMGGSLTVAPNPPRGTRFRLALPLATEH